MWYPETIVVVGLEELIVQLCCNGDHLIVTLARTLLPLWPFRDSRMAYFKPSEAQEYIVDTLSLQLVVRSPLKQPTVALVGIR